MEFLVQIEIIRPAANPQALDHLVPLETRRAEELAAAGLLRRLWRVPGRWANWGLWQVRDSDELHAALKSLPLFPYMDVKVHPLGSHPSDPAAKNSTGGKP